MKIAVWLTFLLGLTSIAGAQIQAPVFSPPPANIRMFYDRGNDADSRRTIRNVVIYARDLVITADVAHYRANDLVRLEGAEVTFTEEVAAQPRSK